MYQMYHRPRNKKKVVLTTLRMTMIQFFSFRGRYIVTIICLIKYNFAVYAHGYFVYSLYHSVHSPHHFRVCQWTYLFIHLLKDIYTG